MATNPQESTLLSRRTALMAAGTGLALAAGPLGIGIANAHADDAQESKTVNRPEISLAAALALINETLARAGNGSVRYNIAVVDTDGVLKASARMDGASRLTVDIAFNKAYTAGTFGITTEQ